MNALTAALFCVLAAAAYAAPPNYSFISPIQQHQQTVVPIVSSYSDGPYPEGSYSYSYEAGNGIKAQEQGQQVQISKDEAANRVQGSYSYPDENGQPIALSYTADENGFHPSGEHLPVAPPVPDAILRALEYIAKHPEEDNL
ncbi:hypothetical protein PUN28_006777 [Cardiocondyla obscurior]|uniref:Uncharacterized protein n=1 Tax=Cardiocondyla obscurior TaxID=286306 RepID=A0AAW2G5R7_9HYME